MLRSVPASQYAICFSPPGFLQYTTMAKFSFSFPHISRLFSAALLFVALWGGLGVLLAVNGLSLKTRLAPSNSVQDKAVLGAAASESAKLTDQFTYWQTIAYENPDYRDAFVAAASLAYRLGKIDEARSLIDRAYALDATFPAVVEMKKILEGN